MVIASTQVYADTIVYKWFDGTGKVIYSQTPPPNGTPFEIVERKSPVVLDTSANNNQVAKTQTGNNQQSQAEKQQEQERLAQSEQIKQENCAQAQTNLSSLTSRGQVTIKEGDLYRKLTEEERQQRISQSEQQIAEFCN